jgi:hypothetical protein
MDLKKILVELRKTPITMVKTGDMVYVDLRYYSATWYQKLKLPNCDFVTYVLIFRYGTLSSTKLKIHVTCEVFKENFMVDNFFVKQYGSITVFNPDFMILIDEHFVTQHPKLLKS